MSKSIAIFLFDKVEEVEFVSVYDILFRAGYKLTTFSIKENINIKTRGGIQILANKKLSSFKENNYDLIFLPGGPGIFDLDYKILLKYAKSFENKLLATICAGPLIFAKLGLIEDKKYTSHPVILNEVTKLASNNLQTNLVLDKNLITAKNMLSAIDLGFAIVELLENKNKSNKLKTSI